MCIGVRVCFTCLERQRDLGKLVVVERQVGNRVIVCGSDGRIVRIHRGEKLSRRLAKDEVGLSRALLGVGALELAVGVDVGRSVGARQGSHVVAVLGLEGNQQFVLELAPLRAARKWGPRSIHRNVGHGRHVREAARKVIVLPVLAGAVGLVVGAHVEHALVGRVCTEVQATARIQSSNVALRTVRCTAILSLRTRGTWHASGTSMCIDRIACAQLPIFPSIYRGYKGVGGVDRDLQGAKVTTFSLCMGSRTEGGSRSERRWPGSSPSTCTRPHQSIWSGPCR